MTGQDTNSKEKAGWIARRKIIRKQGKLIDEKILHDK
jgi:hypothetical protein